MKFLLIGGPNDGQRYELEDHPYVRYQFPNETGQLQTVDYRIEYLGADQSNIAVLVESGTTNFEALEKLIAGYRPESKNSAAAQTHTHPA